MRAAPTSADKLALTLRFARPQWGRARCLSRFHASASQPALCVDKTDASERRCPKHGVMLWPKPIVRPIRFYDLRHTTASHLMQAGAPVQDVQKLLRHHALKIKANIYGHLAPDYILGEVDRLKFRLPEVSDALPFAASLLQAEECDEAPAEAERESSTPSRQW